MLLALLIEAQDTCPATTGLLNELTLTHKGGAILFAYLLLEGTKMYLKQQTGYADNSSHRCLRYWPVTEKCSALCIVALSLPIS
jgi:hypothetical protein